MKLDKLNIAKKISIAVTVTILVVLLFNGFPVFKNFELQVLDFLIQSKGGKRPDKTIVLVLEDEETVSRYGWPLSRKIQAELIEHLHAAGARVIAYDILFTDRANGAEDSALASATQKTGNVIHAFTSEIWSGEQDDDSDAGECDQLDYAKYSLNLSAEAKTNYYYASPVWFPHADFRDAFHLIGHITIIQDEDGHFRQVPLILRSEGCYYPSLALKTVCHYLNVPDEGIRIEKNIWGEKMVLESRERTIKIPMTKKGQTYLSFYGDLNAFPQYSVLDVLSGQVAAKYLKDKIVIIGITVSGDKDSIVTPFSAEFPGVGIHATAISNILKGDFIQELPLVFQWLLLLVLSLVITYYPSLKYSGFFFSSFYTFLWLIVIWGVGFALFKYPDTAIWLKMVQNMSVILLAFIGNSVYEKWEVSEDYKELQEMIKTKEQMMREKDTEIKHLASKLDIFQMQLSTIDFIRKTLQSIEGQVSTDVKKHLDSILKIQDELRITTQRHLLEIGELKHTFEDEIKEIEKHFDVLLEKKSTIKLKSIGTYQTLEIHEDARRIVIIGSKGRSEAIYFSRLKMAFICYLSWARMRKQEWIRNGEILEMEAAAEASKKFGHIGIVGCQYTGKKNIGYLSFSDLVPENFFSVPNLVSRNASEINKTIKGYIEEGTIQKFIRTPDIVQDGRYFLTESIQKIVFL